MSRAAFVIYTDDSIAVKSFATPTSALTPSTSSRIVVATLGDKENVDPLTGQLPSIEDQLAKKRKTNVLVAKLVVTTKAPQPDQKKRKVFCASSSTGSIRPRGEKKERKVLGSKKSRNASSSRVCTVQELPKVEEEDFVVEVPAVTNIVSQATADARCYELTVIPLADVSEAYSSASAIDEELIAAGEKLKAATISNEPSADIPETRASSPAPSISEHERAPSPRDAPKTPTTPDFSTPERKRIYSAFTFSSPSPAGERYAVTRAHNADRFSDLAFTLERTS